MDPCDGQRLDEAYLKWIDNTTKARKKYKDECNGLWLKIQSVIDELTDQYGKKEAMNALSYRFGRRTRHCDVNIDLFELYICP